MSQIRNFRVANDLTSNSSDIQIAMPDPIRYTSTIKSASTSAQSISSEFAYQVKLPLFIDPVRNAMKKVYLFRNKLIQEQVIMILESIRSNLILALERSNISNRLPQIHLTESEDETALIEWNFENFRIGFTIDVNENSISYFFISEDRQSDSFIAETKRIDGRLQEAISSVVTYVIQNS